MPRITLHDLKRLASLAAVTAALWGCTTPAQIAEQAVNANMAVEQAHNRILLLNVVRAYHNRPLYFTSLEQLFGPMGQGRTRSSLSLPFGPEGWGTSVLNLGHEPDAPSFNVAVHDSRAFMRGFLSPVPPATLGYYLRQRWPSELLLNLFVEEIVIVDEDGRAHRRYRNRPRDRGALDQFQQVIRGLAQCDIRVSLEMALRELGPAVPIDDVSQLISAKQARIRLELVESAGADEQLYRAYRLNKQLRLDFKSAPGRECRSIADDLGRGIREAAFYYDKSVADRLPRGLRQAGRQAGQPGRFAVATLRSPESMIYYLGQLARLHNERAGQVGGFDAVPAGNPGPASREERPGETFVIRVSEPRTGAATGGFEVVYEGRSYSIRPQDERTLSALSLISQVIGLQKEANELPGVGTFRVIP